MKFLLDNGADVNKPNLNLVHSFSETNLIRAVNKIHFPKQEELIRLLINAGANVGVVDDFGQTAIDYARAEPKLKGTRIIKILEAANRSPKKLR